MGQVYRPMSWKKRHLFALHLRVMLELRRLKPIVWEAH
jgi:hypothetical protein